MKAYFTSALVSVSLESAQLPTITGITIFGINGETTGIVYDWHIFRHFLSYPFSPRTLSRKLGYYDVQYFNPNFGLLWLRTAIVRLRGGGLQDPVLQCVKF